MERYRRETSRILEGVSHSWRLSPRLSSVHINITYTFTIQAVFSLSVHDQTEYLWGSTVTIDVDNITMFYSVGKSRAKDARMYR